jgi:hypothetical protein
MTANERFDTMRTDMGNLREAALKRSALLKEEIDKAIESLSQLALPVVTKEELYNRFTTVETLGGVEIERIKKLIETFKSFAARNLDTAGTSKNSAVSAIDNLNRIIRAKA